MSRAAAERSGRQAEWLAGWWLRLKGWRILATRVRTPVGEVDIVARRGRTLAFVEVKRRASTDELAHAIDMFRLRRVAAAAELLLARYGGPNVDSRIDVILIAPRQWPVHLANVWHG